MKNYKFIKLALSGWLLMAMLTAARAQVSEIQLQGTSDSSAYEGSTVTVPVIINTAGLTTENILAFRLEIASSGGLKPIDVSLENTLIEGWNSNVVYKPNSFTISAAGASSIALDSGALFWVTYELAEVSYTQDHGYYLNTSGNNYFNEGGYTISMATGYVEIINRPSLSVSVSPSVIVRGDSSEVRVSGGTEPYTLSSLDETTAQISTSSNYAIGMAPGLVQMRAEDNDGLIGTSSNLEVRGFKLYTDWPQDRQNEGDTVEVSIYTTSLHDLNVLSGSFSAYFHGVKVLKTMSQGTLLEGKDVQVNKVNSNDHSDYKISFASSSFIEGPGELLKFQVVVKPGSTSASANLRDDVIFNENWKGLPANSSISIDPLPSPTISTAGSIPSPILPGMTIDFEAANGTAPYMWSLSDPSIASIDDQGVLTALKSGNLKVQVTDANGIMTETSNLRLYDGRLYVKSEVAVYESEHLIPILVSDIDAETSFSAYEMQVNIDTSRISFVEVEKTGTLSEDFSLVLNKKDPRNIRVVGASQAAVAASGILFYFKVQLKPSFTENYTNVYLSNVRFNEGKPDFHISSGTITPGPPPPVAGNSLITAEEDTPFSFGATDFAYSQVDGNAFTRIKIISLPASGTLSYGQNPVNAGSDISVTNLSSLTYLSAPDISGDSLASFDVKVGDANSFSNNTGTVTISVNPVNDPPVFALSTDSIVVDEEFTTTETVTVVESFPPNEENEVYTYSITPESVDFANLAFDPATGQVDITALGKNYGSQKFIITADDGQPEFNIAIDSFVLVVNEFNEAPEILNQTFSVPENSINGTLVGNVIASDPDGNPLSYSITGGNDNAVFSIDEATGALKVAQKSFLDYETTPSFTLTVEVMDAALSASATITVNVTDVDEATNQAPQVLDATFDINENTPNGAVVGTVTAEDPDGSTLTYSIISGNESGAFALSTSGELLVADQSKLDFEVTSLFEIVVSVSDGELSSEATISVHVLDVNEAPELSDASFEIAENTATTSFIGSISATDPDSDVITYSITSGNTDNAFAISATGELTVANESAVDFETSPSFVLTIVANDGELSGSATVTVSLTDVDEAPVVTDQTFSTAENSVEGLIIGSLGAFDPEGTNVTYTISGGNTSGAFAISPAGDLSVASQAALDYEVTPSFVLSVTVSDGSLTSAATVTVNLEDVDETVNQAPQIATQTFWVDENSSDGTVVGTLSAGDPDGDAITFSISAGSNAFNISSAGVLTVADSAQLDYESTQTLTISVQVNDGELTASATITIHINDVLDTNVAPTITDQVFNVKENSFIGYVVGDLGAEDANGDVLSFTLAGNNGGTFSISDDGNLIVADNTLLDFESGLTFSLTVTVSDGALSSSATVTVNITDVDETVNQAPQISNATFTIEENSIFGYLVGKVRAGDPDNDPLSFAIVSGNIGNAFAISSDGVISVADQSQLDYETIQKFELTVSVSDGALADSAFVVIRLADVDESVNQAPQITAQTFSVDENSPIGTIVGTVTAGDPNGDAITFSMNGSTAFAISTNGQISVADITQLDFETTPSFTFTVEVSDGELTASATITVELNDLDESVTNEAPVIADQVFSINENSAVGTAVGTVLATDPEGAPLTYTIVDTTASFAINSATGLITVMSAALLDFETRPSFSVTVEVNDGELSALAVVTINLLDVDEVTNTAPVITDQNFSIDENSANNTVVGTVDAEDPDGNVLSFMITGGNAAGAFGINETSGEILVADESLLDFETTPSFELTVEVSDGELSASATITISLNDLDEGALSTDEGFDVRIYPNPATDIVTLEAHAGLVGGDAVILSVSGEVVYSFSVRSTNQLNIANLPAGIYLIKMVKKDVEMIHRLHKVK